MVELLCNDFPTYDRARRTYEVWDGVPHESIDRLRRAGGHAAYGGDYERFVSEQLEKADQSLALSLYAATSGTNVRGHVGVKAGQMEREWALAKSHHLFVEGGPVFRLSERGRLFVHGEASIQQELDDAEGVAWLFDQVNELGGEVSLAKLREEWHQLVERVRERPYSRSTTSWMLNHRINNLEDRGVLARSGGSNLSVTAALAESPAKTRSTGSRRWSDEENDLVVRSYFAMMHELEGGLQPNKTAHRRAVGEKLPKRSDRAIEYKYQNVSGVLDDLGRQHLPGYLPRQHYQRSLIEAVERELRAHPVEESAVVPAAVELAQTPSAPPRSKPRAPTATPIARPSQRDYDAVHRENSQLGRAGERSVVESERSRLRNAGRSDLAELVEHVAVTQGDGLGYDVLSFEVDGTERFIEVKTTRYASSSPFYASANEVDRSVVLAERYWLYRLFSFGATPTPWWAVRGALTQTCESTQRVRSLWYQVTGGIALGEHAPTVFDLPRRKAWQVHLARVAALDKPAIVVAELTDASPQLGHLSVHISR